MKLLARLSAVESALLVTLAAAVAVVVACSDDVPTADHPQIDEVSPASLPGSVQAVEPEVEDGNSRPVSGETTRREISAEALQPFNASQPGWASGIEIEVPGQKDSVRLYAAPDIGWAVRATIHPTETIRVLTRTEPLPNGTIWLRAESADGNQGWIAAADVDLEWDELDGLRLLDPGELVTVATAGLGAVVRRRPDGSSSGCVIREGAELEIAGQSPDDRWLLVSSERELCAKEEGRPFWLGGWIRTNDLVHDPIFAEAPVVYPYGLWMFPADPQLRPTRLSVNVRDAAPSEAWAFDPEDGALVFVDYNAPGGAELRRLLDEISSLMALPGQRRVDILVAPTGGRILVMVRTQRNACPSHKLIVAERSGAATEIGEACLHVQSGRGHLLSLQARWSPDAQAIIFRNYDSRAQAESGESSFWLYRLDTGTRVDLSEEGTRRVPDGRPAEFHPDGQSIYVLTDYPGRFDSWTVRRLTLDGEQWPGFMPFPADGRFHISPQGDHIIAVTNGVGLLLSDQGELLDARVGTGFQWLADGRRIVYRPDSRR